MSELSPATQLAILLTARWAVNGSKPLTNSEFAELRRVLGSGHQGAESLLHGSMNVEDLPVETSRLQGLLNRGLGVFQSIDRWRRAGIWVVSWADPDYPGRFKQLKHRAPVLMFGYGNPNAFSVRSLAIVGSRNAGADRLNMAAEVGRSCSDAGVTVVSGGARGVDSYAMSAGVVGAGTVVGVLADSLLRESGKKPYRDAIREGRMCLMSEVHPEARFDVGSAMARNRLAYACADAALVVECDPLKGGTWAGALEALKEGKAVYVLKGARAERELVERGAIRIDIAFAQAPLRLVAGERPKAEVPETVQLAEVVRKFLGSPLRPREELVQELADATEPFLDALIAAALSDRLVEAQATSTSASSKKGSKTADRTLFEAEGIPDPSGGR